MTFVALVAAGTVIGAVLDAVWPSFIDTLLGDRK